MPPDISFVDSTTGCEFAVTGLLATRNTATLSGEQSPSRANATTLSAIFGRTVFAAALALPLLGAPTAAADPNNLLTSGASTRSAMPECIDWWGGGCLQDARSLISSYRSKELHRFLAERAESGSILYTTERRAWALWKELQGRLGIALMVPDACPGPDGRLLLTWSRSEHYFEIEVFPNGESEMFYRNRVSEELWGLDIGPAQAVPQEAISKLALFS